MYGADQASEGPLDDDAFVPPRFFSWRTADQWRRFSAEAQFGTVDFYSVETCRGYRFQSMTVRRMGS